MITTREAISDTAYICAQHNPDYYNDDWVRYGAYTFGYREPNYPMPAIRYEVKLQPDRVILWRKQYRYWEFQYLASTIPTKLLNRWAE